MSDLQCPAMVVLSPLESISDDVAERVLAGRNVAGVFLAAAADSEARPGAARMAEICGCALEVLPGSVDGAGLRERVEALADLYRGETICVVASSAAIGDALGRAQRAHGSVLVVVDSSGWTPISTAVL